MANAWKYAGIAVVAAAAGAALALLFAPEPGAVTRRRLRYRLGERREAISERGRALRNSWERRRSGLAAVVND